MRKNNGKPVVKDNGQITLCNTGDRIKFYYCNIARRGERGFFYEIYCISRVGGDLL